MNKRGIYESLLFVPQDILASVNIVEDLDSSLLSIVH
jgi:hypothetical protein